MHLTHNISPLIKLSFNTPKSTRGLDALSKTLTSGGRSGHWAKGEVYRVSFSEGGARAKDWGGGSNSHTRIGCLVKCHRGCPMGEEVAGHWSDRDWASSRWSKRRGCQGEGCSWGTFWPVAWCAVGTIPFVGREMLQGLGAPAGLANGRALLQN
jgi:hypothetical protein